jgi:hypothetical protein
MDKIFKIGLLVLGFSYLAYLYCPHTNQVGRYVSTGNDNEVIDTTNGSVYAFTASRGSSPGSTKINLVTGETEVINFNPKTK